MRNLLRRLVRNRVWPKTLPRSLGGGTVYCSPGAMLSMLKPGWRSAQALDLFAWAQRFLQPGMRVWDVGANQGLFSFAASHVVGKTGRVTAFEPDPFLVALMERSAASGSHRGAAVEVRAVALSDACGVSEFAIAQTDRALNHLVGVQGNPRTGGANSVIRVATVTGDLVADEIGPPDFVKIDVEGAEHKVLRGMDAVLATVRPVLIIEVAAENAAWIADALSRHGYRMFDAADDRGEELKTAAWNTLAVPSGHAVATGLEH